MVGFRPTLGPSLVTCRPIEVGFCHRRPVGSHHSALPTNTIVHNNQGERPNVLNASAHMSAASFRRCLAMSYEGKMCNRCASVCNRAKGGLAQVAQGLHTTCRTYVTWNASKHEGVTPRRGMLLFRVRPAHLHLACHGHLLCLDSPLLLDLGSGPHFRAVQPCANSAKSFLHTCLHKAQHCHYHTIVLNAVLYGVLLCKLEYVGMVNGVNDHIR